MLTLDLSIEPMTSAYASFQRCQDGLITAYHTAKPYLSTAARWTAKGLNILYWAVIYSTATAYAMGMIARDVWERLSDHINAIQDTPEAPEDLPGVEIPDPTTLAEIALCDELIAACQKPEQEHPEDQANYSAMSAQQLRRECQQRGIAWRNAGPTGKHLSKRAMLEALTHGQV